MQKFAYADADCVLFTSDTHFGHAAVINLCSRPFTSVDEMDQEMIERWNAAVRPSDTVWHLGDFAHKCRPDRINWIFSRLNGTKHLIVGNHDKRPAKGLRGNPCTTSSNWTSRGSGWCSVTTRCALGPAPDRGERQFTSTGILMDRCRVVGTASMSASMRWALHRSG